MPTFYLTGTVHWLSLQEARDRAGEQDRVIRETDGTYSIHRLSSEPVQFGQVPYKGPPDVSNAPNDAK